MRIIGGRYRGLAARRPRRRRSGRAASARPRTGCARASSTSSPTAPTATRRRPRAAASSTSSPAPARSGSRRSPAAPPRPPSSTTAPTALALLRRNLARIGADEARRVLSRDATRIGRNPGPAFDLVFLDPPYGRGLGEQRLASALAGGWVAPGGARGLGGGRQPRAAPRLDPARPPPLWGDDDRDLPHDRAAAGLRADERGPAPARRRSSASPTSAPARRRSSPPSRPAATCSPSCRPAAASRSATSSRR